MAEKTKTFKEKLFNVQQKLKAPKSQNNDEGYKYRSAEDIVKALKPILAEEKLILTADYELVQAGNSNYIKATVTVEDVDSEGSASKSALARESAHAKMSGDQCTGCASSYAYKYALAVLFALDYTGAVDADDNEVSRRDKEEREKQTGTGNGLAGFKTTPPATEEKKAVPAPTGSSFRRIAK